MPRKKLADGERREMLYLTTPGKNIQRLDRLIEKLSGKYSTVTRQTILEGLLIDFLDEREKNEYKKSRL